MPVTIAKAEEKDAACLAEAEKACFPADSWSEEGVLSQLSSPTGFSLCAWEDGVPVGYFFGSLIPPEGEVLRIGVLPAYRGQGVGKALLCRFLAETENCFLEVREGNAAARGLYESVGFRQTGRRRAYYRRPTEDACLYTFRRDKEEVPPAKADGIFDGCKAKG